MNISTLNIYSNYNTPSFGVSLKRIPNKKVTAKKAALAVQATILLPLVIGNSGKTANVQDRSVQIYDNKYFIDSDGHLTQTQPDERSDGYYIMSKDGTTQIYKLPGGKLMPQSGTIAEPAMAVDVIKDEIRKIDKENNSIKIEIQNLDKYTQYLDKKTTSVLKELKAYNSFLNNDKGVLDEFVAQIDKNFIQEIVDKNLEISSKNIIYQGDNLWNLSEKLLRGLLSEDAKSFLENKEKYRILSFEDYTKKLKSKPNKTNPKSIKDADINTLLSILYKEQQKLTKNIELLESKKEIAQDTKQNGLNALNAFSTYWLLEHEECAKKTLDELKLEFVSKAKDDIMALFYTNVFKYVIGCLNEGREDIVNCYNKNNGDVSACNQLIFKLVDESGYTFISSYGELNKALDEYKEGKRSNFSLDDYIKTGNIDADIEIMRTRSRQLEREHQAKIKGPVPGTPAFFEMAHLLWLQDLGENIHL